MSPKSQVRLGGLLVGSVLLAWILGYLYIAASAASNVVEDLLVWSLVVTMVAIPIVRKAFALVRPIYGPAEWNRRRRATVTALMIMVPPFVGVVIGAAIQSSELVNLSLVVWLVALILGLAYVISSLGGWTKDIEQI